MLWEELVLFFEELESSKRDKGVKKNILDKLWRSLKGDEFYLVMRLLMPNIDSERGNYHLKEALLGKVYASVLMCNEETKSRLMNWKSKDGALCLSDSVYNIFKERGHVDRQRSYTIVEINEWLDKVATVGRSLEKKIEIFQPIIRDLSALDHKWLLRILLKDMRMKIRHESILKFFHPSALKLYNQISDLRVVCEKCKDPNFLVDTGLEIGKTIRPMLARSVQKRALRDLLLKNSYCCEPKYDGNRILCHYDGDKIRYLTRNGMDDTPLIAPKFDSTVKECVLDQHCILDGEILVYDNEVCKFKEFGKHRTHGINNDDTDDKANYCYMVFDVLVARGKDVSQKPLQTRRKYLEKIIKPKENWLMLVPHVPVKNIEEAFVQLEKYYVDRYEGIMLKDLVSVYNPGERQQSWLKWKFDTVDGMGETFDLSIIGGYTGTKFLNSGDKKRISTFLLGIRISDECYHSFVKVGTGYGDEELRELDLLLRPYWKKYPDEFSDKLFDGWKPQHGERPDFYIDPRRSKVVEVRAQEIVKSDKFRVGFTLRFPRVLRFRDDKHYSETLTMNQLKFHMKENKRNKVMTRKRAAEILDNFKKQPTKRQKVMPNNRQLVDWGAQGFDLSSIEVESNHLNGKTFCIFQYFENRSKEDFKKAIIRSGGRISQNVTSKTDFIVACSLSYPRVQAQITAVKNGKSKDITIVSPNFVVDSIHVGRLKPLLKSYVIYASREDFELVEATIDEYGDSYFEDATIESLKECVNRVNASFPLTERQKQLAPQKMIKLHRKYPWMKTPRTKLMSLNVYFANRTLNQKYLFLEEIKIQMLGGQITHDLNEASIVIIDDSTSQKFIDKLKKQNKIVHRSTWVEECYNSVL